MKRTAILFPVLLAILIAGCSGLIPESKKLDYKSAGKLPSLEVPPDLTQPTRDERYAVPETTTKGSATFSAYAGERAGQPRTVSTQDVLPQIDKMRIERAGTQRWLVMQGTPERIWPSLKEFWQELGFLVNIELPEAGVLETDWNENRAKLPQDFIRSTLGKVFDDVYSTPERDKFRTRIEKGVEPGTVEIYISHRGMYEIYVNEAKSDTKWQPRPADPELEAEMLRRLMVRLGADDTRAKTLLSAQPQQERAKLTRGADGIGSLQLDDSFDRAWRRVGLALDRVGFTVEDRDRTGGIYFVRYVDSELDAKSKKDDGFLSKLMFWKSSSDKTGTAGLYRVLVKATGNATAVTVLTREGGVDTSETSKRILGLLHEQLK
jgi:outer membrane protein assembly factor BamC